MADGMSFFQVFKCCGGDSRDGAANAPRKEADAGQLVSGEKKQLEGIEQPDSPATPAPYGGRRESFSKQNGQMRARANLRKSIVIRRRSTARIYQQEVINPSMTYDPDKDEETDDEDVASVMGEEKIADGSEITLELVRKVMSGSKDRFDKACKYHPGSHDKDEIKFNKYHEKSKAAFRKAAYLCEVKLKTMDKDDPMRPKFIENQGDAYRNLGILFNEQTPRVKTAVANFDKAAALMRELGDEGKIAEEKIVKHALLQSCDTRLKDYKGGLEKAERLLELRETDERKKDAELFRKLVDSGDKTAIVRFSESTNSYYIEPTEAA